MHSSQNFQIHPFSVCLSFTTSRNTHSQSNICCTNFNFDCVDSPSEWWMDKVHIKSNNIVSWASMIGKKKKMKWKQRWKYWAAASQYYSRQMRRDIWTTFLSIYYFLYFHFCARTMMLRHFFVDSSLFFHHLPLRRAR